MIGFTVYGIPAPQGGTTSVPTAQGWRKKTEGGKNLLPWRQGVAAGAKVMAEQHGCLDGPLALDVVFRFPMPKSAPKRIREFGWAPKSTIPDVDKLLRAIGDSLKSGGLVVDDARFADVRVRKISVWESWTGAVIRVGRIDEAVGTADDPMARLPLGPLLETVPRLESLGGAPGEPTPPNPYAGLAGGEDWD